MSWADKAECRRHYRALRRASLAAAEPGLRAVALERLPSLLPAGLQLGLWWPVGSEPDLAPSSPGGLAERLGGRLALPAVLPAAEGATGEASLGRLVYLPWDGRPPQGRDLCGIPAPLSPAEEALRPLPPAALGLLLVPALAVDRHGVRLGSGGGWYDRLRADPAWRSVPALAVLPAACVVEQLPRDPWDLPFAGWLDERGLWQAQGAAPLPEG